MALLQGTALQQALETLSQWQYATDRGGLIQRRIVFADFSQAFGFMTQCALYAQQHNHHPEWSNVYNRVNIILTTHDVNGLSPLDIAFAKHIDSLCQQYGVHHE